MYLFFLYIIRYNSIYIFCYVSRNRERGAHNGSSSTVLQQANKPDTSSRMLGITRNRKSVGVKDRKIKTIKKEGIEKQHKIKIN